MLLYQRLSFAAAVHGLIPRMIPVGEISSPFIVAQMEWSSAHVVHSGPTCWLLGLCSLLGRTLHVVRPMSFPSTELVGEALTLS